MSEQLTSLPAVAKSVFTNCKKCERDTYHVVLAHKTATSAKVECEICKAKKTYSLPKVQARKAPTGPRKSTGTGPRSIAARAEAHKAEYSAWMTKNESSSPAKYNMREKFASNQKIEHPKFGLGFVRTTFNDKIEVVFLDEVRSLVHNRA